MTKSIYALAFALVVGTTGALASPGDDGCVGNCPQEGGGPTEITNENTNTNTNNNEANAGAIAGSSSDSTATGIGVGGSSVVGVAVKTGPTVSGSQSNAQGGKGGDGGDAYATGGNASATSGDSVSGAYSEGSVAGASVGDVTSSTGASSAHTGDNSVGVSISDNRSTSIEYEQASARAASVYSQVCQNGGSAQGMEGGFGVSNSDVLCDHLKMASVMREAYIFEMKYGVYTECTADHDHAEVTCVNDKAQVYLDAYHEHMGDAMFLMDKVEEAGMIDKFMGYMVRPAALIGALIWLI